MDWLFAVILGLIEGLTEFIPVSSTGHLLLAKDAFHLGAEPWDSFVILIQFGAILAVIALYFQRLWGVLVRLPSDPAARKFALSVIIAFIPAVIAGVLLYDIIKHVLFESPGVICWSLIVGGLALLVLERFAPKPRTDDAMKLTWMQAIGVGLFQCLALIPGVSRSGATISGGMMLGLDKKAAAEFSFFLAIPTMAAAFAKDLMESYHSIQFHDAGLIAVGFIVSFISGAFVIKSLLTFVERHGFAPFAWWRIIVGALGLGAIWMGWIG